MGTQFAKQPAMQSSIQTTRQTTCPVAFHLPGKKGQRPTPVGVCGFHRDSLEQERGGSIWRTVLLTEQWTKKTFDSLKMCPSLGSKRFLLGESLYRRFSQLKKCLVVDLKYFTRVTQRPIKHWCYSSLAK